jgi:putative restriction endonuclease
MTVFSDLVRSPSLQASPDGSLGQWQREVDALFPAAVSKSPFRLWSPGDPIPATGDRLLIGVATWSAQDLALLDAVSQALATRRPGLVVDVFNVAECPSPQAFERYVPGMGNVFHTPVVGLWSDGRLVDKASGKVGRELIELVGGLVKIQTRNNAKRRALLMIRRFDDYPTQENRALQIWQILVGKAANRQTLTYGQLADNLGFKGAGTLAHMLGHIMYFCQQNQLPPLTVLVVNQDTGLPGEGLTGAELNADREKVFRFRWYDLMPPTPEELADAYRRGSA